MSRVEVGIKWKIEGKLVDLTVSGNVIPYWPGVRYYKDGSGAPPEGGYLEDIEILKADGTHLPEDVENRLADDEIFNESVWAKIEELAQDEKELSDELEK